MPMRVAFMTSTNSSRMASVDQMSPAVMVQSAPEIRWTVVTRAGPAHARHQERDDVVDRERDQQQRKADQVHGRAFPAAREPI